MRSNDQNKAVVKRSGKSSKNASKSGDSDSKRLAQIAKRVGNTDLSKHLSQNANKRDALLALISSRLNSIHEIQKIELDEKKHQRDWYKEVARGAHGYHLPDPTKWHECAKMFQKAAQAMCNGHLGKGAQIMEEAIKLENKARDNISIQVKQKMERVDKVTTSTPIHVETIAPGEFCTSKKLPIEFDIIKKILNIIDQMPETPPVPFWWEYRVGHKEEEEEEEEEEE